MPLNPLNHHYAIEHQATVYDEEAMTALELAGKTTGKVNETVEAFNKLEAETKAKLTEQDDRLTSMEDIQIPSTVKDEVDGHIASGDFDRAINKYASNLEARMDNMLGAMVVGSTTGDAELIDMRTGANNYNYPSAGTAVRSQFNIAKDTTAPLSCKNLFKYAVEVKHGFYYPSRSGGPVADPLYKYYVLRLPAGRYLTPTQPSYFLNMNNGYSRDSGDLRAIDWTEESTVVYSFKEEVEPVMYAYGTSWLEVEALSEKVLSDEVKLPYTVRHLDSLFTTNNLLTKAEKFPGTYMKHDLNYPTSVSGSYDTYRVWVEPGTYTLSPKARFIANMTAGVTLDAETDDIIKSVYTFEVAEKTLFYFTMHKADINPKLYESSLEVSEVDMVGTLHMSSAVEAKNSTNTMTGKTWVACGDSFTAPWFTNAEDLIPDGTYKGKAKVYPYIIGNRNSMTVINEAISGSTLAEVSGATNHLCGDRKNAIPANADYITIKIGINDSHVKVPIGTINDTSATTFLGAWNILLEYLATNFPFAKVGVIVSNGVDSVDYANATIDACEKWGVPYLDLATDTKLPVMLRTLRTDVCSTALRIRNQQFSYSYPDNMHPNAKAHEFEASIVENWLRSI